MFYILYTEIYVNFKAYLLKYISILISTLLK